MQCPVCHKEVASQSAFCGYCGSPLSQAAPEAVPPPPGIPPEPAYAPPAAYSPAPAAVASSGLAPNTAAALAYITIIPAILFLILEPYNKTPFVRFHAFQSIGLAIVWFVVWVVVTIVSMVFTLPGLHLLFFLFPMIHLLVFLIMFLAWLVALIKASKGEWYKLPLIGELAMKQAQS